MRRLRSARERLWRAWRGDPFRSLRSDDLNRGLAVVPVLAFLTACSDGPYADVTSASHDCAKASRISIKASDGTFGLTGTCEKILVNGARNRMTIEAAKTFELDGTDNTVLIGAVDSVTLRGSKN